MKKLFILFTLFFLICSLSFATEKSYTLYKIGETITTDIFKFTLNSVRWDHGDEYFKSESGKNWLVIDCTVQNMTGSSAVFSSMLSLSLFDDDGYAQDVSYFTNTKGSLDGTLAPSQTMRGELAYVVDSSHSCWELVFQPDWLSSDQYFYQITKEQVK
jgi:hypothetical protein